MPVPEGGNLSASVIRKKKMRRCLCYVVLGIIIQILVILVFVLTVMPIRNLKVRLGSVNVENLNLDSRPNSPSFSMKLVTQVIIRNTNFGHYNFERSNVIVSYKGDEVGNTIIDEGHTRARSTTKVNITLNLSSVNSQRTASLFSDINSGKITLSTYLRLSGEVHLSKVIKRKKTAQMNCTMDVNRMKIIENLRCK